LAGAIGKKEKDEQKSFSVDIEEFNQNLTLSQNLRKSDSARGDTHQICQTIHNNLCNTCDMLGTNFRDNACMPRILGEYHRSVASRLDSSPRQSLSSFCSRTQVALQDPKHPTVFAKIRLLLSRPPFQGFSEF